MEFYEKLKAWAKRHHIGRKLLVLLIIGSIVSVMVTYVLLTKAPPFLKSKKILWFMYSLDFVFLMSLAAVVAKYLAALWAERRSGEAGSMLHSRIVAIFSFLAILPTILIATFSAVFFNSIVNSWFNERVETSIGESIAIAGAYLGEHQKVISANAEAMAVEFIPYVRNSLLRPADISQKLTEQTQLRSLDEAIILTEDMQILGRSQFSFALDFEPNLLNELNGAKTAPVVYTNDENDRVRALVRIDPLTKTYLLVGRRVSPTVVSRIENAMKASEDYERLKSEGSTIVFKFIAIFVVIAVVLLLTAVLGGLLFANKLSRPIRRLISASDEVCQGNLSVRISEEDETEELSSLTSAFNRMTSQLESQRDELMEANEQINERRRFTEAVLSGVSAGVIGLDSQGNIQLYNESATQLLGINLKTAVGQKLKKLIPEMASLFEGIADMDDGFIEQQITMNRKGHNHTFLVRLSPQEIKNRLTRYVMTFDDITQLQVAQRNAAWAEMARRIAHEIKNPLTPIQLSAERLKRRYSKQIKEDPESFQTCVDTIIRQVGHIGQMVGEFSSFARMPIPDMQEEDLIQICKEEIFLQQHSHPALEIRFKSPLTVLSFSCDRGQIGQVLTNLVKNAIESVQAKGEEDGKIEIDLNRSGKNILLKITDNGVGLPPEGRERLTEPYITFRDKGTGLGLAIVKKIVEDHGGNLSFHDAPHGGAIVQISFVGTAKHDAHSAKER